MPGGYYLYCYSDQNPCPDTSQSIIVEPSVADYAALGITGASLTTAVGLGAGIIFTFALLGFSVGAAIKMIKHL